MWVAALVGVVALLSTCRAASLELWPAQLTMSEPRLTRTVDSLQCGARRSVLIRRPQLAPFRVEAVASLSLQRDVEGNGVDEVWLRLVSEEEEKDNGWSLDSVPVTRVSKPLRALVCGDLYSAQVLSDITPLPIVWTLTRFLEQTSTVIRLC
jgi:hypothetical protein